MEDYPSSLSHPPTLRIQTETQDSKSPSSNPIDEQESDREQPQSTKRIRITDEGVKIMRDVFETNHWPDRNESLEILHQITSVPGCGHYTLKNVQHWFADRRRIEKQKQLKRKKSPESPPTPSAVLSPSTPNRPPRLPQQRIQITERGARLMRDAFDEGIHYPSPSQKQDFLRQITALPNCDQYQIKHIERWFQRQRTRSQVTNTANLPRQVAIDPEAEAEEPISHPARLVTLSTSAQEKLQIMFSELSQPSIRVMSTWAELLEASLEDVEAWVVAEQQRLEYPSPVADKASQEILPQEEQKPPRWRPLHREVREVTSTQALFIRIPGQGSKRRLVSIGLSQNGVEPFFSDLLENPRQNVMGWSGDPEPEGLSSDEPMEDEVEPPLVPSEYYVDHSSQTITEELNKKQSHSPKSPSPSEDVEPSPEPMKEVERERSRLLTRSPSPGEMFDPFLQSAKEEEDKMSSRSSTSSSSPSGFVEHTHTSSPDVDLPAKEGEAKPDISSNPTFFFPSFSSMQHLLS